MMKTKKDVGIVDMGIVDNSKMTILKKAFKRDYFLYMLLILPALYFLVFK